ncbi:MAG: cytochrome c oxidase subunit II [Candidatus Omnitrophica bacterium]|nr:cytochrome c oxidase subunit II [Candidatus Omnitrophota bacterium]
MQEKYYGWGLPVDVSVHGWQVDQLIVVVHVFMAVLFIGWFSFLIYALIRFRQKPAHQADARARHFKLPTYVEAGVALFEVVLLCAFSFPIFSQARNEFPREDKALKVRVVAEQFAWNVHYPGKDGLFGRMDPKLIKAVNPLGLDPADPAGRDDVTTVNQLRVPVHTPVIVELASKDVIHSFAIPVMRVKQDVIPGQTVRSWFEAKQTGNFQIVCAQLCGLGHYRMRGFFTVQDKDEFRTWFDAETAKKTGQKQP